MTVTDDTRDDAAASAEASGTQTGPRFTPPCGPVTGFVDGDVVRATGIPYARAARFAAPTAAPDWSEPFDATRPAPVCPQNASPELEAAMGTIKRDLPVSEDCQNLSITLPADLSEGETLPVLVFIHGGSYVLGSPEVPAHDPRVFVTEQRVIVVGVTYRLGLFGFLGDGGARPANLGLLDIMEAFRWVNRNIAAFGGDTERITAMGQSAGADAIAHIMATPDAASLFCRAIIQSPPLGIGPGRAEMNARMVEASSALNAETSVDDILALQTEVTAIGGEFGLVGGMPFGVQFGQAPLPAEKDVDAAWAANAAEIDVLVGQTEREALLFMPQLPLAQKWRGRRLLGPFMLRTIEKTITKGIYTKGIDKFVKALKGGGGRVHRYLFSWSAPNNPFGSAHTIDLPFLFGDENTWRASQILKGAPWSEIDAHGRRMRQLWADFARGEQLPAKGSIEGLLEHRAA